jgi:hypothetical protein
VSRGWFELSRRDRWGEEGEEEEEDARRWRRKVWKDAGGVWGPDDRSDLRIVSVLMVTTTKRECGHMSTI